MNEHGALHPAAAAYRDAVRREVGDLPYLEVEEILDDVTLNLADVAGELGEATSAETLRARLGAPEEYAAELRSAAGYPAPKSPDPNRARFLPLLAAFGLGVSVLFSILTGFAVVEQEGFLWAVFAVPALLFAFASLACLRQRDAKVTEISELRLAVRIRRRWNLLTESRAKSTVSYARSLQPAWWLARAGAAGAAVAVVSGSSFAGVVVAVLACVPSVILGRRAHKDRRWLWIGLPASGLALGLAFAAVFVGSSSDGRSGTNYVSVNAPYASMPDADRTLLTGSGGPVGNIYPFTADGKLLTGVYLFDEQGRQLRVQQSYGFECQSGPGVPEAGFPASTPWRDPNGVCRRGEEVPFTVAIPKPQPAVVPTPTPFGPVQAPAPPVIPTPPPPVLPPTPSPGPSSAPSSAPAPTPTP